MVRVPSNEGRTPPKDIFAQTDQEYRLTTHSRLSKLERKHDNQVKKGMNINTVIEAGIIIYLVVQFLWGKF